MPISSIKLFPTLPSMQNPLTSLARLFPSLTTFVFLSVGLTAGWTLEAKAAPPETAPSQLKELLTQIDAAANRRDLQAIMQFYDADFRHSDGLTRTTLEQALTQFWQRHPELNYRTELKSWETQGNEIVAETVTTITGTQSGTGMDMKLESTLRSRTRFENQQIVQQDILAERTQLTSGANPPTVDVFLPEQVEAGESFNFDVVVKEPLGNTLLLGTALEQPIKPESYTNPAELELDLLPAGGIFKMGKAPLEEEDRWLSAVLIRGDGMTLITQRLQVR